MLSLESSEFSNLISISAGLYCFSRSKSMLSTSFEALTTCALLMWANYWCQRQMHLFGLKKWVCWLHPILAIVLLVADITWPGMADSRVNRLWFLLVWAMIFPFLINVIVLGLLWYMITLSQRCPNNITFESQFSSKATLQSLIVVPTKSGTDMISISFVQMTWLVAVTKSMLLAWVLLKSCWSLHKCCDAHKSKN